MSPAPVAPVPNVEPATAATAAAAPRFRRWAGLSVVLGGLTLAGLLVSSRLPERASDPSETTPTAAMPDAAPIEMSDTSPAVEPSDQQDAASSEPERQDIAAAPDGVIAAPDAPSDGVSPVADAPAEASTPMLQSMTVPIPMPRPSDLQGSVVRRVARPSARRVGTVAAASPPVEDTRSFFDKLFGIERPSAPPSAALAYASLDATGSVGSRAPLPRAVPPVTAIPVPRASAGTAVYDITARSVTLPSGEKLEAHSGLGSLMDDPRHVHVRMRGPTPPGTYDLTEREEPFHGVRALRMTPVGGSDAIHGRDGILAHTYMLGPSGASNGCVVFRDYDRFLQAYLRGEITRLVVVAGSPQDGLPSLVKRILGTDRPVRVGSAE